MGDTVSYSLHGTWTWKKYTLGGLKIDILCYFTSWFLFTFTSTFSFSMDGNKKWHPYPQQY